MLTVISSKTLYKFSNTQISVPKAIASKVQKWGKENIASSDVYTDPDDPTLGREDEPHITVKYGLHTSDAEEVREVVEGFGSFEVKLDAVSIFEREEYDVVKIGVKSSKLHRLNKLIEDSLETTTKFPEYVPHLTLAYIKKGSCKDLVGNDTFKGTAWSVDEIQFCSRSGKQTSIAL